MDIFMKLALYYNVNKLLCSPEGEAGAVRLIEKLRNGELKKVVKFPLTPLDTAPNPC